MKKVIILFSFCISLFACQNKSSSYKQQPGDTTRIPGSFLSESKRLLMVDIMLRIGRDSLMWVETDSNKAEKKWRRWNDFYEFKSYDTLTDPATGRIVYDSATRLPILEPRYLPIKLENIYWTANMDIDSLARILERARRIGNADTTRR